MQTSDPLKETREETPKRNRDTNIQLSSELKRKGSLEDKKQKSRRGFSSNVWECCEIHLHPMKQIHFSSSDDQICLKVTLFIVRLIKNRSFLGFWIINFMPK